MKSVDYIAFNIILDDIVYPDGQTKMGVLGGGGPQTAFGMRLWSDSVGLVAGLGDDFPDTARKWIDDIGLDSRGLKSTGYPTLRAWQVLEKDDSRLQVWRVNQKAIQNNILLKKTGLPESYMKSKGFHFGIHPHHVNYQFLEELKALGVLISVEPFRPAEHPFSETELRSFLEKVDIFSPNLVEARSYLGDESPETLLKKFIEAGARIITIRMGPEGSLIGGQDIKPAFIPAVDVSVVDTVGAGNAYCGGFLAGWDKYKDPIKAGIRGAVSASFLVEQVGLPEPSTARDGFQKIANLRIKEIEQSAHYID